MIHDGQDTGGKKRPEGRYWRHAVGWPLLLLGIAGLALPFLQGILFIVIALTILAPEVPLLRRLLETLRKRYPAAFEKASAIWEDLKRRFGQR
ncbi:MAG: hypothetical protein HPY67_01615 [Syntrophaceae bacterium]|nr:hypothetical protein [Syntrophaceae bacterium]